MGMHQNDTLWKSGGGGGILSFSELCLLIIPQTRQSSHEPKSGGCGTETQTALITYATWLPG